jgi:sporulation protein YlmC with PRC-barrel domain
MEELAGWVAPIATALAAMMTASNLGTKITGWGFVVFTVGSLAWILVAIATDQTNLLLTNGFLMIVNVIGIWRWLGRQATYDKGARAAEAESEQAKGPELFQVSGLPGRAVENSAGDALGHVVDAMAECQSGRIAYLVVREGTEAAISERLHALQWDKVIVDQDRVRLTGSGGLKALPEIAPAHWPARTKAAG